MKFSLGYIFILSSGSQQPLTITLGVGDQVEVVQMNGQETSGRKASETKAPDMELVGRPGRQGWDGD